MSIEKTSHADSHVNITQWNMFGRHRKERRAMMVIYAVWATIISIYGVGLMLEV